MTIGQRVKIRRISIHALREEGDCEANNLSYVFIKFLSTPSARRATRPRFLIITTHRYFYPRPPRGGRLPPLLSIRFPPRFLSTPSARRATDFA